jgi:hypothetical protein
MGQRASNTATITFNDVEIPAENLLGEENKGFKLAMMTLDRTRPGVAAMAVGIARAAFEFATEYSKERVQFGVPIAMHQAIQFMIADMATKVEACAPAHLAVGVLLDQGKRNTLESSHAKRFAADTAMEVTTDAVQVYGGYGFIKEYPVEKLMRDAKIMQLYEGTSQIQRLVIARETLLPRGIRGLVGELRDDLRRRPEPHPQRPARRAPRRRQADRARRDVLVQRHDRRAHGGQGLPRGAGDHQRRAADRARRRRLPGLDDGLQRRVRGGAADHARTNHALYISHYPLGPRRDRQLPRRRPQVRQRHGHWLLLRTFVGSSSLTVASTARRSTAASRDDGAARRRRRRRR